MKKIEKNYEKSRLKEEEMVKRTISKVAHKKKLNQTEILSTLEELEKLMGNTSKSNFLLDDNLWSELSYKMSMDNENYQYEGEFYEDEDLNDLLTQPSEPEPFTRPRKKVKPKRKRTFDDLLGIGGQGGGMVQPAAAVSFYADDDDDDDSDEKEKKQEDEDSESDVEDAASLAPVDQPDKPDETFEKVLVCESRSRLPPKSRPDRQVVRAPSPGGPIVASKPSSLVLPPIRGPTVRGSPKSEPGAVKEDGGPMKESVRGRSSRKGSAQQSFVRESSMREASVALNSMKTSNAKVQFLNEKAAKSVKEEPSRITPEEKRLGDWESERGKERFSTTILDLYGRPVSKIEAPMKSPLCSDTYIFLMEHPCTNVIMAEYTFQCNQYESISKFKDKLSVLFDKPFYLIEFSQHDEAIDDAKPFLCFMNSEDSSPTQKKEDMIQLRVRKDIFSNLKDDLRFNVSFEPIPSPRTAPKLENVKEGAMANQEFLGGYVDNVNCKLYYHATSQTFENKPYCDSFKLTVSRRDKATQIVRQRNLCMQTPRDTSTQMTGVGVFRSMKNDKYLAPSGLDIDFMKQLQSCVVIVQSYIRRWFSKRVVEARLGMKLCIETTSKQEEQEMKEDMDRHSLILNRNFHPKTKDDFDILYLDLEMWRLHELEKISQSYKGAQRKAALACLLDEETRLIRCIGDMQLSLKDHYLASTFSSFIDEVSKPRVVRRKHNIRLIIDTWDRMFSRQLHQHYRTLDQTTTFLSDDVERFSALSVVKKYLDTVEHGDLIDLKLELLELIERETTLTLKRVPKSHLMPLRKRTNNLFQHLIKMPQFNEAVGRYKEFCNSNFLSSIMLCHGCHRNLPVGKFLMTTNSIASSGRLCVNCHRTNNRACKRADNSLYATMLLRLRKQEREFNDDAFIAFLIQAKDLEYLVNCVWQMRSVLSKDANLRDLVFVRWHANKQWSPWNCVLLTNHEAYFHRRNCATVEEAYSQELINSVKVKHTRARNDFKRLEGYVKNFKAPATSMKDSKYEYCPKTSSKAYSIKRPDGTDALFCSDIRLLG